MAVRDILVDADWIVWASLGPTLPLLAEAAPEEFMAQVEAALPLDANPLVMANKEESMASLLGGNYFVGLLWALETLAWSPEYFSRVIALLARLGTLKADDHWTTRIKDSVIQIVLPWLPGTCASFDKQKAAINTLVAQHPKFAWEILLALLPRSRQVTSKTAMPKWREFIPEGWKPRVSKAEFWSRSQYFADRALTMAKTDLSRLRALVSRISDLPPHTLTDLLVILGDCATANLSKEAKEDLWNDLTLIVARHRRFATSSWALRPDVVDQIEAIAIGIRPSEPRVIHKRLFGTYFQDIGFYEEGVALEEQEDRLDRKRIEAAREIYEDEGLEGIWSFAAEVQSPASLGNALGASDIGAELDSLLPGVLNREDDVVRKLFDGFIWRRFYRCGWGWIDDLDMSRWQAEQIALFFTKLPFTKETWSRAERLLGEDKHFFWKIADGNPYRAREGLRYPIERLIEFQRPVEAIRCIAYQVRQKQSFHSNQAVEALLLLLERPEFQERMDIHDTLEVIKALQEARTTDSSDLMKLEWGYLKLLDGFHGGLPLHLWKCLANDPMFFCEAIRGLFVSTNETAAEESDKGSESKAELWWGLLHGWKRPPGMKDDGGFDGAKLKAWVEAMTAEAERTGHLDSAQGQLGHVLKYAPKDSGGFWIHRSAAEVLNRQDAGKMRNGYFNEWIGSRGTFSYTAGEEERKLASKFREKAESAEVEGFVNLATTMRDLGRYYAREAEKDARGHPFEDLL